MSDSLESFLVTENNIQVNKIKRETNKHLRNQQIFCTKTKRTYLLCLVQYVNKYLQDRIKEYAKYIQKVCAQ